MKNVKEFFTHSFASGHRPAAARKLYLTWQKSIFVVVTWLLEGGVMVIAAKADVGGRTLRLCV
jgi:hypothetical protein